MTHEKHTSVVLKLINTSKINVKQNAAEIQGILVV